MKNDKVYLTLQNGKQFVGTRFGADGDIIGELVFTTGMTGYIETLTDPSYYGQIVTQTFPLIGNYGIIKSDCESRKPWVSAYIVREKCDTPSNFRCEETLDEYLKENNIVVFPNGNWVTNKMYYNSQKAAYLSLSEEPITEEEIANNTEYANKLLDVSNDIIVFDLLNEEKNKKTTE